MSRAFEEYRETPIWKAIATTIAELTVTREIRVDTAPDYVIGYLCRELAAKHVLIPAALERHA